MCLVQKITRATVPKPAVPKRDEKPIHGLVSDKNFIVANAVENILAGKPHPNKLSNHLLPRVAILGLRAHFFVNFKFCLVEQRLGLWQLRIKEPERVLCCFEIRVESRFNFAVTI